MLSTIYRSHTDEWTNWQQSRLFDLTCCDRLACITSHASYIGLYEPTCFLPCMELTFYKHIYVATDIKCWEQLLYTSEWMLITSWWPRQMCVNVCKPLLGVTGNTQDKPSFRWLTLHSVAMLSVSSSRVSFVVKMFPYTCWVNCWRNKLTTEQAIWLEVRQPTCKLQYLHICMYVNLSLSCTWVTTHSGANSCNQWVSLPDSCSA